MATTTFALQQRCFAANKKSKNLGRIERNCFGRFSFFLFLSFSRSFFSFSFEALALANRQVSTKDFQSLSHHLLTIIFESNGIETVFSGDENYGMVFWSNYDLECRNMTAEKSETRILCQAMLSDASCWLLLEIFGPQPIAKKLYRSHRIKLSSRFHQWRIESMTKSRYFIDGNQRECEIIESQSKFSASISSLEINGLFLANVAVRSEMRTT